MTPEIQAAFYVTTYADHLNGVVPEHPVLARRKTADGAVARARPRFRVPDLKNGKVPGVEKVALPFELEAADYWICNWTDADLEAMDCTIAYDADEAYVDQWPDIWNMDGVNVNARGREALEAVAPGSCLFFPANIYKRGSDERIGDARWVVFMRHWLSILGPEEPFPKANFDPSVRARIFRELQSFEPLKAFCNELGVFAATPLDRAEPTYSADAFTKLLSHGVSGLGEKTSKTKTFHELREVIAHVW